MQFILNQEHMSRQRQQRSIRFHNMCCRTPYRYDHNIYLDEWLVWQKPCMYVGLAYKNAYVIMLTRSSSNCGCEKSNKPHRFHGVNTGCHGEELSCLIPRIVHARCFKTRHHL